MDLNPTALKAIDTGLQAAFTERLTGAESTYGRIAMTVISSNGSETYPKLSEIRGMREWIGDRQVDRLQRDAFVIQNRKFESTLAISVDDIEDDAIGIYRNVAGDMGQGAAELPDELCWEMLASGFDTTHYDGQYFFDTDHPVEDENGAEVSVSNFQGGSGTAWYLIDTSKMLKPIIFQDRKPPQITAKTSLTDDNVFQQDEFLWGARRRCAAGFGAWQLAYASKQTLNAANLASAIAAARTMKGPKGRKMNLFRRPLLVVDPTLEVAARELLTAERNASGATNVMRGMADLHVENWLA